MNRSQSERYLLLRQRKRLANECIAEGLNLTVFAERAGISVAGAQYYLQRNAPDLHRALKDGRWRNHLSPLKVLHRLRVICSTRTQAEAARKLGMTKEGVHYFLKRYCDEGSPSETLEEYEFTYGTPLLDQNTPRRVA